MWLYIPKTTSACTQVEAGSISASDSRIQMLAQSYTWNESFKPPRSWLTILKRDSWSLRLFGLIPEPSIAPRLLTEWIGSLVDSPANHSQSPVSNQGPTMNAGSGLTSSDWLARYDREDCSWRTSQASFMEELNTFSEGWPRSGTMRNGFVYERPMLARPIAGKGCLSWLTPFGSGNLDHTGKYGAGGEFAKSVVNTVENWPTVRGHEVGNYQYAAGDHDKPVPTLSGATQSWATPTSRDHKDGANPSENVETNSLLGRQAPRTPMPGEVFSNTDQTSHRRLNYRFVEWLIGLPSSWTDFHALLDFESSGTE